MISFRNVCKEYITEEGTVGVYRDFNLDIEDGEFVLLTGKSGSGKTTLLKLILKETEPEDGEIIVNGQKLSSIQRRKIPYYRRTIGVIFQDFRLVEDESVYDNLHSAIIATGGAFGGTEKKITDVLRMLGIDNLHKRYPRELSGGEKQKVCLARAVINHPKILLADEPTGNLDPISSSEVMRLLSIIHQRGTTVVMATNDPYVLDLDIGRRLEIRREQ